MAQCCDGAVSLFAGVNELLSESTNNAIESCVDFANLVAMCSGCLDHAAGAGVNNSGYAAGLCVKEICFGHEVTFVIKPVAKCLTRCNGGLTGA